MHTRIPQAKRFWTSICRSILWAICGSVSTLISFTVHSMNRTFLILGSPKYRFKSIFLFASGPLLGGVMPKRKGCGPPSLVLDRVPGIASIDFLGCSGFEHAIWKQDGKCQSSIKKTWDQDLLWYFSSVILERDFWLRLYSARSLHVDFLWWITLWCSYLFCCSAWEQTFKRMYFLIALKWNLCLSMFLMGNLHIRWTCPSLYSRDWDQTYMRDMHMHDKEN